MGNKAKATATNTVVVHVNTEKKTRRSRRRAPTKQPQVAQTATMPIREIIRESPQMQFSPFMQSLYQPYPEHTKPNTVHAPVGKVTEVPNNTPAPLPLPAPIQVDHDIPEFIRGYPKDEIRKYRQEALEKSARPLKNPYEDLIALSPQPKPHQRERQFATETRLGQAIEENRVSTRRGTGS
jgi:hypothetical protein